MLENPFLKGMNHLAHTHAYIQEDQTGQKHTQNIKNPQRFFIRTLYVIKQLRTQDDRLSDTQLWVCIPSLVVHLTLWKPSSDEQDVWNVIHLNKIKKPTKKPNNNIV